MAKKEWIVIGSLWAAAFGLRCLYIYQSDANPFFDFPLADARTYMEAATQMAVEGQRDGDSAPFWQPPLYTYFLGLVFWLFMPDYYIPRLIQAVLGALNCVLLYFLGRQVFSRSLGLIAASISVAYGPFLFFEAEFLPPVLAIFLNLLLLLSLLWAVSGGYQRLLLPGLLLGLSALCVTNILFFMPFAGLWIFWQDRGRPLWQRLLGVVPLVVGTLLVIAPVALHNYVRGNDLVLISSNTGFNFYIGNNADYERTVRIQSVPAWQNLVSMPRMEAGMTCPSQQSCVFFGKAGSFIREHPGVYVRLLLQKTYCFWNGNETGHSQDLYYARNFSSLLSLLLWKFSVAFPFGVLAPLALMGIGFMWIQGGYRTPEPALLLLVMFSYTFSIITFFVTSCSRLPTVPVLLLFAAYGVGEFYNLIQRRQLLLLTGVCSALLVLFVGSNFRIGRMDMEGDADTHYRLGFVFQQKDLYANAIAAYQTALALDPTIPEARFNLGSLYALQGRFDRAIAEYQELIARYPEHVEGRYALGNIFLRTGRYHEAIDQYNQLLGQGSSVNEADIQGGLAYAYAQIDRPGKAIQAYHTLLQSRPDVLLARYQLGQLYEARDMIPEARQEYEEILRRDSTHAEARYRLAVILFIQGSPEEAKAHMQRLIAQKPADTQAHWFLAKQYIVEHKRDEALEQVVAILRIDPTHAQANRLAGHLYLVKGDTLTGATYLDLSEKYYTEKKKEEALEALKKRLSIRFESMIEE